MKPLSNRRAAALEYLARFDRPTTIARGNKATAPNGAKRAPNGAPLALSDHQLALVRSAARAVPLPHRDEFLQSVAARLADTPSDAAVAAAVNVALDRMPVFLSDSLPPKESTP